MKQGRLYRAALAALCVLAAALLCFGAAGIYREGAARKAEHPLETIYTPEAVAEALAPVAPLLFFILGMTAAGLLLGAESKAADRPVKDPEAARDLLCLAVRQPSEEMNRERALQKRLTVGGWAAFGGCMVPILLYFLDQGHFPKDDLEAMIAGLARTLIPWTAAGVVCLTITAVLRKKSVLRETEAAKAQRSREKGVENAAVLREAKRARRYSPLQAGLCAAAAGLIAWGVCNGSALDVLYKAIKICSECIGLG